MAATTTIPKKTTITGAATEILLFDFELFIDDRGPLGLLMIRFFS